MTHGDDAQRAQEKFPEGRAEFPPQYEGFPVAEPPVDFGFDTWQFRQDGRMFATDEEREIAEAKLDAYAERMFPIWMEAGANWASGSYDLRWLERDDQFWGQREVEISKRGLTLFDINKALNAPVPDRSDKVGQTLRGAEITQPMLGTFRHQFLKSKAHVWADSAVPLYEEAVARQWSATRDIPWETIKDDTRKLPFSINKASGMLATFLAQLELDAGVGAAEVIPYIGHDYHETIMFHLTQGMDEARHLEVFKKRATVAGGLTGNFTNADWASFIILNAPSMEWINFTLQGAGEGLILSLFRMGEYISPTEGDKEIYRRCMQDEARHVSFGQMRLRTFMQYVEDKDSAVKELELAARLIDTLFFTLFTDPSLVEPIAVLAGGGVEKIDDGMTWLKEGLYPVVREEYLARCESMGIDWRWKTLLPEDAPF